MEKAPVKLTLPNPGTGATFQVVGDHIIFLYLNYDECVPNPLEDVGGLGTIYSFSRRHSNFKHPDELEEDDDRVTLSYFEHGLCKWGVGGTMDRMPDFQWDGVGVAGVWYPDDCIRNMARLKKLTGHERKEWMEQRAADACKVFTKWCNGEVYFCSVSIHPVRYENGVLYDRPSDYRFADALLEESFGGCYDMEELRKTIDETLEFFRKREGLTEVFEVENS